MIMVGEHNRYECYGRYEITKRDSEFIIGNVSKDIELSEDIEANEIRADIEVQRGKNVRLWGLVKDCNKEPVPFAMVKLAREMKKDSKVFLKTIAQSICDHIGFFQFDICVTNGDIPLVVIIFVDKNKDGSESYDYGEEYNLCLKNSEKIIWLKH
ncbi:MAG: hypothetical protein N4A68_13895 [Maledivibacter sp.]|nr:hypothetical protein [Maledivibacter sp.]